MAANFYLEFKKELGYIDATNQYIEMIHRYFHRDYPQATSENLNDKAREVGLCISTYDEGTSLRIARNYIVNIHSCMDHFLKGFKGMKGSPANGRDYDPKDDNRLHWTLKAIYGKIPEDVQRLYFVCEYYRLLRNIAVHSDDDAFEGKLKTAYNNARRIEGDEVFGNKYEKLNAPNQPGELCFDDQVLFSRAARDLVEHIVYDSKYSLSELIADDFDAIVKMVSKFINNPQRMRKSIAEYIGRNYAAVEFEDAEWERLIEKVINCVHSGD